MHPKLIDIGPFPINSYGFMIMVGFLVAAWVCIRRGKKIGFTTDLVLDVGIFSMLLGIVGAKINYLIQYQPSEQLHLINIFDGGLEPIGAVIFGLSPYLFLALTGRKSPAPFRIFSWRFLAFCLITLCFALFGGRLLYIIFHAEDYLEPSKYVSGFVDKLQALIQTMASGFVFYGGLVVAVLSGIVILKIKKTPVLKFADLAAPCIMLGLAFGRIGCFLNGCCFGQVCADSFPLGVAFPKGSPPYETQLKEQRISAELNDQSLPVHPAQLYEAAAVLGLFFLLSYFYKRKKVDGETLALLGISYPLWRFLIEFIRGDNSKDLLGLTYSQVVSILLFILSVIAFKLLRRKAAERSVPPTETATTN